MNIIFMGTPDYAVDTLEALIENNHTVKAVFCQPDKPVGRKHILTPPPVKVCANKYNIPVFQPTTLKSDEVFEDIKNINPDVIVVVAYGKILPKRILDVPKFGCVNGHASLLPKYRGASPIQWCIVSGEKVTGITTMLMDEGMDTGDILEQIEVPIGDEETAESLFSRLQIKSAKLMIDTLNKLEKNEIQPKKQGDNATYALIIKKEMAKIDFNKTADVIHNEIRGYYSWPCSFFIMDGKRVKVIDSRVGEKTNEKPNTVIGNKDELIIACGENTSIRFLTLQPEGSKQMSAKQMLCGKDIKEGTIIKE